MYEELKKKEGKLLHGNFNYLIGIASENPAWNILFQVSNCTINIIFVF